MSCIQRRKAPLLTTDVRRKIIMHSKINDWKNGWFGVELAIRKEEIDPLIELLKMIKDDPDQHFHLSSSYKKEGGLGDIEICIQHTEEDNMITLGGVLAPGERIDERKAEPDI